MKYLFSLVVCVLFSFQPSLAREIIIITYNTHEDMALLTQDILINQLSIPSKLITLKQASTPCLKSNNPIMHLCINDSRELEIVEMKKEIVTKSFGVFKNNI